MENFHWEWVVPSRLCLAAYATFFKSKTMQISSFRDHQLPLSQIRLHTILKHKNDGIFFVCRWNRLLRQRRLWKRREDCKAWEEVDKQ